MINDEWYDRKNELRAGMKFSTHAGSIVMLDRTVPGDGTRWHVADWDNGWVYCDSTIEPGDLFELLSCDPE